MKHNQNIPLWEKYTLTLESLFLWKNDKGDDIICVVDN